ncbi:MAG TPA: hypothetical protein DIU15_18715 [Deltaproteobacteria bacterium]|nr:hypothetical protein [Deltaproteobacteria bacterium]HCP48078.1 hypothetical protein [Deltaproteobacteria bacterium]
MSVEAPQPSIPKPGKVQAIGIMHLVSGILNLLWSVGYILNGLVVGIGTLGLGLICCCPVVLLIPTAILEIISAIKHLKEPPEGLEPQPLVSYLEIACILCCNWITMTVGIVGLVFLQDEEVKAYYRAHGGNI